MKFFILFVLLNWCLVQSNAWWCSSWSKGKSWLWCIYTTDQTWQRRWINNLNSNRKDLCVLFNHFFLTAKANKIHAQPSLFFFLLFTLIIHTFISYHYYFFSSSVLTTNKTKLLNSYCDLLITRE